MLNRIGEQLELEEELDDFWSDHRSLPPLERWMTALRKVVLSRSTSPVILFIDEIDMVRSLPFKTDEFFAGIRACYNRRDREPEFNRLTFCLLGVAAPTDLIHDVHITPFNIGTRIELQDFTPQEASKLSVSLSLSGRSVENLLERVLYWTGGHPYLTQRLCAAVAGEEAALTEQDVDRLCRELFFSTDALQSESNLSFVSNRLLRSEGDIAGLLDLYRKIGRGLRIPYDETNPLCRVLRLSGVTTVRKGVFVVHNRIYEQAFDRNWVQKHMPDAEIQRQKAAYRAGIFRAAGVSAPIVMVFAILVGAAIVEKNAADTKTTEALLQSERADQFLYVANMNLVQRDWEINNVGHVLELLEETRTNKERGFEWDYWNRLCHLDMRTLKGHTKYLTSAAFSPDGERIVTSSWDTTAKVWDVQTGKEMLTIQDCGGPACFSPDDRRIVSGSNRQLR